MLVAHGRSMLQATQPKATAAASNLRLLDGAYFQVHALIRNKTRNGPAKESTAQISWSLSNPGLVRSIREEIGKLKFGLEGDDAIHDLTLTGDRGEAQNIHLLKVQFKATLPSGDDLDFSFFIIVGYLLAAFLVAFKYEDIFGVLSLSSSLSLIAGTFISLSFVEELFLSVPSLRKTDFKPEHFPWKVKKLNSNLMRTEYQLM